MLKLKKILAVISAAAVLSSFNIAAYAQTQQGDGEFSEGVQGISLEGFDIPYNATINLQIPNEKQNGVYFLSGNRLSFYFFDTIYAIFFFSS